jgi:hypothetical protein
MHRASPKSCHLSLRINCSIGQASSKWWGIRLVAGNHGPKLTERLGHEGERAIVAERVLPLGEGAWRTGGALLLED